MSAILQLQCLFRGLFVVHRCLEFMLIPLSVARRRSKAQLRQVIILQSQWRRKLAVRELRGLRTEAKSASKFKEISYQLENKVVELTQTLQRRTADNKELASRVRSLEQQVSAWHGKHEEVHSRAKGMEAELAKPTVPASRFEEIMAAKAETDRKMQEAATRVALQEREVARLTEELQHAAQDLEDKQYTIDSAVARTTEDASITAGLRSELSTLKEQISRSNALHALTKHQREPPTSPTANGLRTFENGGPDTRGPSTSRRRVRRHSTTGTGALTHARNLSSDEILALKKGQANPRAVSVMYPQNGPLRPRDSNGLPTVSDNSPDEIVRLLEDDEGLDEDVLKGLIQNLKIPAASLHNPPLAKEVIFPAHLISLVSNEMWKLGMIPESERFLANVMQEIQNYVIVSRPTPPCADLPDFQR
jgi:myosin-5